MLTMTPEKTPLPANLTPEQYVEKRLDDQIQWMEGKSAKCQTIYKRLKTLEIMAAAAIPFLTGYITSGPQADFVKLAVGGLGALIAISSGISGLGRYQELWIEYRGTVEALRQHRFLYATKTLPYHTEEAASLLVQNIETLLAKKNSKWVESAKQVVKPAEPGTPDTPPPVAS